MSDVNYDMPSSSSSGWSLKLSMLFGAVLALIAANVYLFVQLDKTKTEFAKFKESVMTEVGNLRETSSVTTATNRRHLDSVREELEAAKRQAQMAVGQAKVEAVNRAEVLTKRLAEEQKRQQQQVATQISEVKQVATDATTKLGEVSTDVTNVKTEVAATKSELEKTIADLKRVNGDMGVMSGLIATNGKELSALRALGDRNYFEFNLRKSKQASKVGDVSMVLKKADAKKNRFTIELVADDKTVEKKDKNVNEPVQFYVSKARQPYELVVNEVRKDQIVGYLSTPKLQVAR